MTPTPEQAPGKLIHIARIYTADGWHYLFLKKNAEGHFSWHEELNPKEERETPVSGQTVEEAMRLAPRHWKNQSFTTVNCGFRYTLPERDEHGINALYHQMAASYSSGNGIYYDEELGNNCFVQNASEEAVKLSRRLNQETVKTAK
ncbi:MAG TPA: hypothetical protein VGP47_01470 [Parachlamydiaceae bacterium]|nr:hypothetical protein [Parachlamydiaceae bacterium]